MLTLLVNGVPALKLSGASDIPLHQGIEPWQVRDESGRTIDSYQPGKRSKRPHQSTAEPERPLGMPS